MNLKSKFEDQADRRNAQAGEASGVGGEVSDAELEQVLAHFRQSVHAWSDAELTRPRLATAARPSMMRGWRVAAGWALGCALAVCGVSGGLYEHQRQTDLAKVRAAQQAEQQKQLAAQKAQEEEDLLARVDSDIAREVPSAMEPLAQLMDADESK